MAFPKNQSAEDPVSEAPGDPGADQLEELGLGIRQ
jgi:aspartyl-tRNA synthetase